MLYLKSLIAAFVVLNFALLLSGCTEKKDSSQNSGALQPADLLPALGAFTGWTKGDFAQMDNYTELYAVIDGGAEIYVQHGFVEGVKQVYNGSISGSAADLDLYVYDQGSETNCAALLDETEIIPNAMTAWNTGNAKVEEAYLDETLPFDIVIKLRADRFYVQVRVDKGNDDAAAKNVAQSFALAVVEGI